MAGPDVTAVAAEAFDALMHARQIAPFSRRPGGLDLATAYAATAELRRLRAVRGERTIGRKIGFTNRTIWDEYKVYAPIWGDMFDSTVHENVSAFALAGLCEPRIEPEIVFRLARAPRAGMAERELLGCVEWIGHGYEVVQSIFPGWHFEAADCVAGGGLHGAFLIGDRIAAAADEADALLERLANFEIELACDGKPLDTGHARNVLDGPLAALKHLVELLADDVSNPPLGAGELVTTGTVTRAFQISPGERWTTRISGLPLAGMDVTFKE